MTPKRSFSAPRGIAVSLAFVSAVTGCGGASFSTLTSQSDASTGGTSGAAASGSAAGTTNGSGTVSMSGVTSSGVTAMSGATTSGSSASGSVVSSGSVSAAGSTSGASASGTAVVVVTEVDAGTSADAQAASTGAACGSSPAPAAAACGAALCGNGVVDTCQVATTCPCGGPLPCLPIDPILDGAAPPNPWPNVGPCATSVAESCDGMNLNGATCASLGYAGGTLACSAGCTFDTRGCQTCSSDPHIQACKESVDCARVQSFALASPARLPPTGGTGGGGVPVTYLAAVAWVAAGATVNGVTSGGAVEVGIVRPDLSFYSTKVVDSIADGVNVALSASPSGLLLAVERSGQRLEVIPLDGAGNVRGAAHLIMGGAGPVMAQSEPAYDGSSLLVWSQGSSRLAALVADDGSFVAPPVAVSTGNVVEPEFSSGTFAGDGFLYAERTDGVTVTKISLTGKIVAVSHPANGETEYPQLAWLQGESGGPPGSSPHAVLTYADFSGAGKLMFETLDASGAATGTAVELGAIPTEYNRSPILPMQLLDGESAVLLGGYTGGTDHAKALSFGRLSPSGVFNDGPFVIASDPGDATAWRAVPFDDGTAKSGVLVGWIGGTNADTLHDSGSLHLARVNP